MKQNATNTPKLRFPEFSGEWEEKRLELIAKVNPTNNKIPKIFSYIDLESVKNGILSGNKKIKRENAPSRAQRVLQNNDILFQTVRPYQKNNFYFNLIGDYVASTGYAQLRTNNNSQFLYHLLHTDKFVNKVLKYSTGTNYPAINSNDLKRIEIKYPRFGEQQKIASFLSAIDKWIESLKKQKEKLEKYKKGMMQKIFSQEIRFKDDNGKDFPEWEIKKLSNFLLERNEKYPKDNNYPLMAFVAHKGVVAKGDRYNREFLVNDSDNKKYKRTEFGDFIYSSNNLETGSIGMNQYGPAVISPVYSIFRIKESYDYQFINRLLTRKVFINKMLRYRQGVIYGQWRIRESDILKIEEKIPSLEEQQKISEFLTSLDNLIQSKQQKISQAENWKKGLMQRMFV